MAFQAKDFSVLAYANGFTLWHYTTVDVSVEGADYLTPAADMVRVGDIIIVNTDTQNAPITKIYTVTGNSDGIITLADFSAHTGSE